APPGPRGSRPADTSRTGSAGSPARSRRPAGAHRPSAPNASSDRGIIAGMLATAAGSPRGGTSGGGTSPSRSWPGPRRARPGRRPSRRSTAGSARPGARSPPGGGSGQRTARTRTSVHALFAEALGQGVRPDHEDQADEALEQAHRGGEAELAVLDAGGVHEGVEDFADVAVHRVQQQEHVLEAELEEVSDREDEQHDD